MRWVLLLMLATGVLAGRDRRHVPMPHVPYGYPYGWGLATTHPDVQNMSTTAPEKTAVKQVKNVSKKIAGKKEDKPGWFGRRLIVSEDSMWRHPDDVLDASFE